MASQCAPGYAWKREPGGCGRLGFLGTGYGFTFKSSADSPNLAATDGGSSEAAAAGAAAAAAGSRAAVKSPTTSIVSGALAVSSRTLPRL